MDRRIRVTVASCVPLVLAGILVMAAWASDQADKSAKPPQSAPTAAAPADGNAPAAEAKPAKVVVARIGDYEITKDDLVRRLLQEIRPQSEEYAGPWKPVSVEAVTLTLVAEKAMSMEGRSTGALNDPIIQSFIERQKREKLAAKVIMDYIRKNLTVSDAEVDEQMKAKPELTRDQAGALAQRTKGMAMLQAYYKELLGKFQLKPVKENFAKAVEVHQRLLLKPAKPRNESWILNSQARDEVTAEEKAIVLATYDGGQVTLKDWLGTLCDIVPPGRPKDLGTPEGVERLLDRTLRPTMLVAEAKARGFDKDPEYLREMRELEDMQVLYKVQGDRTKDVPEPNDAQIAAFYEKNKEWLSNGPSVKIDPIWFQDLATAQKARGELDGGKSFAAVKEAYSPKEKVDPYATWRGSEGPFWDDLWKSEPNQVVGPVKGFGRDGLAWRIVRILEKTPAKERPLSEVHDTIKWTILGERRRALLDRYGKELRDKYKFELYADRIQGLDPLDVALYPREPDKR